MKVTNEREQWVHAVNPSYIISWQWTLIGWPRQWEVERGSPICPQRIDSFWDIHEYYSHFFPSSSIWFEDRKYFLWSEYTCNSPNLIQWNRRARYKKIKIIGICRQPTNSKSRCMRFPKAPQEIIFSRNSKYNTWKPPLEINGNEMWFVSTPPVLLASYREQGEKMQVAFFCIYLHTWV